MKHSVLGDDDAERRRRAHVEQCLGQGGRSGVDDLVEHHGRLDHDLRQARLQRTADIDEGKYTLYSRQTTGTGGSKCSGPTQWMQFYSVRQNARACGQISLTKHFDAWKAAGMTLGKMDQAQILVEVGGGQGSVEFPVANVTAQ